MTGGGEIWRRRSIRIREWDYSRPGAYFVTICTAGRTCVLGTIADGVMAFTRISQIAATAITHIDDRFPGWTVESSVVMPNHVHLILVRAPDDVGTGDLDVGVRSPNPGAAAPGSPPGTISSMHTGLSAQTHSADPEPPEAASTAAGSATEPLRATLGQIVAFFKYVSTKEINSDSGPSLMRTRSGPSGSS